MMPVALLCQDESDDQDDDVIPALTDTAAKKTESSNILDGIDLRSETKVILRLINGDMLTGIIEGTLNSAKMGRGISLRSMVGTISIYEREIAEIRPYQEAYRHGARHYLMPTAEPLAKNNYIGLTELLFLNAGFGWEWLSVMAGTTVVPGISWQEQAKVLNVKATVAQIDNEKMPGGYWLAVGMNLAFINNRNALQHIYANGTFALDRTRFTSTLFYKVGNQDIYQATAGNLGRATINLPDGTLGLGLAFDIKISDRHDVRALAELWCADLLRPQKSAAFLGLRLHNTRYSADIGLAMFTAPALAPAVNFAWLPW